MAQPQRNPRIVVVGAGVAGIGTATKLKDLGFNDITLVEASENVGGRIGKANLGNTVIDTGAQYIHGASERNPLYCLFKKYDLLSQDFNEGKHIFYNSSGQKVDEKFAEQVYEAGEKIIRYHGVNTGKSIGEHFAEKAADVLESYQGDEKKLVQSVLAMVGKDFLLDIGASNLHEVSLDSWQYYTNMGEDLNVQGLMFQMVDRLREEIPNKCLLLNKAVSKIEWNGIFPGKDLVYPVRVVCKDGDEILADHVVVTLSLGCLKAQASTLFHPSLSNEKMEVIDKLHFGNIGKIFLEYEEAFWENGASVIRFLWNNESVKSVSASQTDWLNHLQLFTVMTPKEKFGNVLICWCHGEVANLIETMPETDISHALTKHIRFFTGNPNIPPPRSVSRTQWCSNEYIRGAVTYLPVGQDAKVMDVLAEPLSGNKQDFQVLFAGEATMKNLYGTVQGALMSGYREAESLARHYGLTVNSAVQCGTDAPVTNAEA